MSSSQYYSGREVAPGWTADHPLYVRPVRKSGKEIALEVLIAIFVAFIVGVSVRVAMNLFGPKKPKEKIVTHRVDFGSYGSNAEYPLVLESTKTQ